MKKMKLWFAVVLVLLAFILMASLGNTGSNEQDTSKTKCLSCHGPYEKLAAKPLFFKGFDPKESKITIVNPHQYWPHNDKTNKGIPDCIECHKPHKEDMRAGDKVEKASIEKCFGCHHDRTFDRCTSCHEN